MAMARRPVAFALGPMAIALDNCATDSEPMAIASPLLAAEARPTAIEPSASDCATLPMAMASVPVAAAPPPVLLTIRYCEPPPARPAMAEFNWPMVATSLLSIPLATLVIRRCRSSLPTETVFSAWAQELLPKATDPS